MTTLPGFPAPTAQGHGGLLRSIVIGPSRVLVALGRVHLYEGHHPTSVVHAVRTAAAAGCRTAVLTNAAGSLHADWSVGGVAVVTDHINFTGLSPLTGPNPPPGFHGRFVSMVDAYTPALQALVHEVEPGLPAGVYVGFHGPQFETPAEIRAAAVWGADLVGMSMIQETIAARHLDLDVLGLSLVTNLAAGVGVGALDGDHMVQIGAGRTQHLADLLRRIIERLPG